MKPVIAGLATLALLAAPSLASSAAASERNTAKPAPPDQLRLASLPAGKPVLDKDRPFIVIPPEPDAIEERLMFFAGDALRARPGA